ncbi:hypothetical protein DB345_19955 [Spartobacteria bacterium LR76]|nr:hypothetical protein DB345_19955 [Spartobacteria bacterium LR76]
MPSREFFSCDWGTSHFRVRLVNSATLEVRDERVSEEGVSSIFRASSTDDRPALFAGVLGRHLHEVIAESGTGADRCVISGMASSTIGWVDLPYAVAPLPLHPSRLERTTFLLPVDGRDISIVLVSGIRTTDDVMRGEECELLGLLELCPELVQERCLVVLPGTHSKHIVMEGRILADFQTFMTGELFAHLRKMPTLSPMLEDEGDESDFLRGVRSARDVGLTAALFKIRARRVIGGARHGASAAFLSGLLIGDELLHTPDGLAVYLAGAGHLHSLYLRAGEALGLSVRALSPEILRQAVVCAHRMMVL